MHTRDTSNIDTFLMACQREFGMPTEQLFRSVDLTEGRDLFSVTMTLNALARKVRTRTCPLAGLLAGTR
jgi:hypothetical protein